MIREKTGFIYANISEKDKKIISDFIENNIPKEYHYSGPGINNISRNHTDSNIMIIDGIIDNPSIYQNIYDFCDIYKSLIIKNFQIETQNFGKKGECKVLQIIFKTESQIYNIQKESKKFKNHSRFEGFFPVIKRDIAFVKKNFDINLLGKLPVNEVMVEGLYYYDY